MHLKCFDWHGVHRLKHQTCSRLVEKTFLFKEKRLEFETFVLHFIVHQIWNEKNSDEILQKAEGTSVIYSFACAFQL